MRLALLVFALACDPTGTATPIPRVVGATDRVQALRLELHAVQQAWSEGRRHEARARAQASYQNQFEPLEPALRALDPVETLELEYAFGDLDRRLRRNGDALGIAQVVQRITRGTDELVATLPPSEDGGAAPAPAAAAPKAEAATLPAHLRSADEDG